MARKQKPFAYFDNLDTFKSYKISCSENDDEYIDFENDEQVTFGTPDIMYETFCVIDEEKLFFTHGQFYNENKIPWTHI